jgi:hypothetical protein
VEELFISDIDQCFIASFLKDDEGVELNFLLLIPKFRVISLISIRLIHLTGLRETELLRNDIHIPVSGARTGYSPNSGVEDCSIFGMIT